MLASAVVAQQSTDGPYVLHEYVESIQLEPGANSAGGEPTVEPSAEEMFASGQPPALSLETRPGEPIYDKDGPVFDRPIETPYGELSPYASANKLDSRTDRVDSLTYFANFDPSIIPYKRVVVKNHAVRRAGEYALEVYTTQRRNVEIQPAPNGPHDTFWGTFLLSLERGRLHPIASVSPDQRILQLVVEPDIELQVSQDGADNFFVRSSQEGLVRVNVQLAVPTFYFGGTLPAVDWSEFPTGITPPMDAGLRAHVLGIAQRVGFTKTKPPAQTVVDMVAYFRDFDARPFPEELQGDDLLTAICTSAIGVCRHRSLAFVFLAQAMGIPARYVYNEAHAFVEIFWPNYGWRRLDLGGAANELNASANDGRQVHDPGPDGLPTPERFLEEQQRMAHNGWEPPADAPGQRAANGRNGANNAVNGGTNGGQMGGTNGAQNVEGELTEAHENGHEPLFEEPPEDLRADTLLRILDATKVVRRGDAIRIEALLTGPSGPLQGQVEVYLGAVGSTNARAARRLGVARAGRDGRVATTVDIPREHAIGRWSLFLRYTGDEAHKPAVAE